MQPVQEVAKNLLGKLIVKRSGKNFLAGMIVETEAYDSVGDKASHSHNGISRRNRIMFEVGGSLYIYLIYGIHCCANVVAGEKGIGAAVLIRAVEPIDGIELMMKNRFNKKNISERERLNLTSGPAKFCSAFGLTMKQNGTNLLSGEIFITDYREIPPKEIIEAERIGISKSKDFKWRYYIHNNPFVSKK